MPAGIDLGGQFRLLFATSTRRDATSADIDDYNRFVQEAAEAGHPAIQPYATQFRVVGSTATVDARDNTGTTGTGVPIYWLGGAKVADNYADFYDGSWESRATRDQRGRNSGFLSDGVWTGSNADGTKHGLPLGRAAAVQAGDLSNNPLSNAAAGATTDYHVYALSPLLEVEALRPVATTTVKNPPHPSLGRDFTVIESLDALLIQSGKTFYESVGDSAATLAMDGTRTFELKLGGELEDDQVVFVPLSTGGTAKRGKDDQVLGTSWGDYTLRCPDGSNVGDSSFNSEDPGFKCVNFDIHAGVPAVAFVGPMGGEGEPALTATLTLTPLARGAGKTVSLGFEPWRPPYELLDGWHSGPKDPISGGRRIRDADPNDDTDHVSRRFDAVSTFCIGSCPPSQAQSGNSPPETQNSPPDAVIIQGQPEVIAEGVPSDDESPYAAVLADAEKAVTETDKGEIHVDRWRRVLAALGVDNGHTPMPASEAQGYVDRGWTRWEPVAAALAEIEAAPEPESEPVTQPEPDTQPTTEPETEACVSPQLQSDVEGYSQETSGGEAHVERWLRVLHTFAGTANDSTIMLPAEARTYRDKGWARWIPVVDAIECLEERAAE